MPQRFLIIDGYNLLHAAGMGRYRYGPGGLEKARHRLLNYLANRLTAGERARTTIVFDAGDAPYDTKGKSTLEGMTILFAQRGGDADTVIERLIEIHSAPRQIHLVSSDHRLQKAARKRRAKWADSEVFFADLELREAGANRGDAPRVPRRINDPKFTGEVPPSETDLLLQIFADAEAIELGSPKANDPETVEAGSKSPASSKVAEDAANEDNEKITDIDDAEWHKYLAEFPEDLDDLLRDT